MQVNKTRDSLVSDDHRFPVLESRELRDVLGLYATGIAVVTTVLDDGEPLGVTVNSFTSVSLDPPLILFCILNRATHYAHWERGAAFTVNILAESQQDLSNLFARPSSCSWERVEYADGQNGAPVLTGSLAAIECIRERVVPAGDHLIVIGRVVRLQKESDGSPLLYYRGGYAHLGADARATD